MTHNDEYFSDMLELAVYSGLISEAEAEILRTKEVDNEAF